MHVGNLRSALYEFLIAKHAGGDFMLRIEDTDLCHFLLISAGDPYPFCTFRPTLPCLYIPVRPLSEGRTTSLFYRLFSKTATVKTRFSDGADSTESVPPETGSP